LSSSFCTSLPTSTGCTGPADAEAMLVHAAGRNAMAARTSSSQPLFGHGFAGASGKAAVSRMRQSLPKAAPNFSVKGFP
jgi:hypothetical protein